MRSMSAGNIDQKAAPKAFTERPLSGRFFGEKEDGALP